MGLHGLFFFLGLIPFLLDNLLKKVMKMTTEYPHKGKDAAIQQIWTNWFLTVQVG
jgi:hypothetical protein